MIKPRCKVPKTEAAEPSSAKWRCRTSLRCEIGRSYRIPIRNNPTEPEIAMIVDRYDPINLFEELVPKLNLKMEPELRELDRLLEDDVLFEQVRADLCQRHPNSGRLGRHSTPVEVILRMLVVKRLYGFSYEQTERFVSDSIVLRRLCRLYLEPAPDDTTLIRWANQIGPETVACITQRARRRTGQELEGDSGEEAQGGLHGGRD